MIAEKRKLFFFSFLFIIAPCVVTAGASTSIQHSCTSQCSQLYSRDCLAARCCSTLGQAPDDPAHAVLHIARSLFCLLQLCFSLPKAPMITQKECRCPRVCVGYLKVLA